MQLKLKKIIYGGQTLGTLPSGQKALIWGGLPDELVEIRITKKKPKFVEGIVEKVIQPSPHRVQPKDPDSYQSTSPWQILDFQVEQQLKSQLITEAFTLHHIDLSVQPDIYTDDQLYAYRNKLEFSWYSDTDELSQRDSLDLAFFKRGGRGKIPVQGTSLASLEMSQLACQIRDLLHSKFISARQLKSLIIRSDQSQNLVWQLYTKDQEVAIADSDLTELSASGGEIIYSDPKSPASRITKRLQTFGNTTLTDRLLGTPFNYNAESFFQVNIPVYEQSLKDIKEWIDPTRPVIDMYAGVGTIGLTVGGEDTTLVEIDEHAVREMRRNIKQLNSSASAVLAPSEQALDHITSDKTIILDPPRAGLHPKVVERLLDQLPPRIIYLSCNPSTQARDASLLLEKYQIAHIKGYNFFPRTPHIENLVVLSLKA